MPGTFCPRGNSGNAREARAASLPRPIAPVAPLRSLRRPPGREGRGGLARNPANSSAPLPLVAGLAVGSALLGALLSSQPARRRAPMSLRENARSGIAASFRQHLEAQCTGDRRRLDEAHRDCIAEPIGLCAGVADQRVGALVVAEIFLAERRRRDEAIGAGVVELDEQAGARDAADVPVEDGAD